MATIEIKFTFCNGDDIETEKQDFEVSGSLQYDIDAYADDRIEELDDESDDEDADYLCDDKEVSFWDDDYPNPSDFSDLDDYGLMVELIDEHGEGFKLRYEDIGDLDGDDFRNSYNGCWSSEAEFAENYCDDCMEIPDNLKSYFDYEKFARDLLMDYSVYEGDDGFHIFSDY